MSKIISLLFICVFMAVTPARAGESPWSTADQVRARLVPGTAADKGFEMALEVELAEGWHTYWQNPGDAGLPPQFDWSGSKNIKNLNIEWPYPKRFDEMGIVTFGYEGRVEFYLEADLVEAGVPSVLDLNLDIMVCKDICIPQKIHVSQAMPAVASDRIAQNPEGLIRTPEKKRKFPVDTTYYSFVAVEIQTVVAGPDALAISAFSGAGWDKVAMDVFPVAGDIAFTAKPEVTIDNDKHYAMIKVAKPSGIEDLNAFLKGKSLYIVLVAGRDAVKKTIQF